MQESLISKYSSNVIKGILTIVIVAGHNVLLTSNIHNLFSFFYLFQIFGFFILPWMYVNKPLNRQTVIKRFYKLYIPYFCFYILLYFLFNFIYTHNGFNFSKFVTSFVFGAYTLKETTGFVLLWFLPAFFFSMLFKDIFFTINKKYRIYIAILLVCFTMYIHLFFKDENIVSPEGRIVLIRFMNLYSCVLQGIYFMSFGIISWIVLRFMANNPKIKSIIINILFIYCIIVSFCVFLDIYINPFIISISPIAFFIIIFWLSSKKILLHQLFEKIGKLSLPIYLVHPLIFYSMYGFIVKQNMPENLLSGIVVFLITMIVAYYISYFMMKSKFVTKYIFGIK